MQNNSETFASLKAVNDITREHECVITIGTALNIPAKGRSVFNVIPTEFDAAQNIFQRSY